jgi:spore coat polysaccharide biosynthesis protein SpsF
MGDVVVKIPSDCPLIDPEVIDQVIVRYHDIHFVIDYVSNLHPQSYPDGNDVEVFSMQALECAWREATAAHEREHTTPFIWDNPDRFFTANVKWETGRDLSRTHRWTIDYPEDYALVSKIYDHLWSPDRIFSLDDILGLLDEEPSLMSTNARYAGVKWYHKHLSRLRTVTKDETRPAPGLASEHLQ